VGGTPLCAGAPRGVVPPCGPPAVLCAPLWSARAPCAAPPCGEFLPRVLVPPCGVVTPTETIAVTAKRLDASGRSLHGDTRGAATLTLTGHVSGGLGRRTPSSTARSRR